MAGFLNCRTKKEKKKSPGAFHVTDDALRTCEEMLLGQTRYSNSYPLHAITCAAGARTAAEAGSSERARCWARR